MNTPADDEQHSVPSPVPVRRLSLQFDGKDWVPISELRVASMTLPASDPLPAGDRSRGFWIETVNPAGQVLHREVRGDPFGGMEIFHPGGGVSRHDHGLDRVVVEVLIPLGIDVAEVHLVSNPASPAADHGSHPARMNGDQDGPTRWVVPADIAVQQLPPGRPDKPANPHDHPH